MEEYALDAKWNVIHQVNNYCNLVLNPKLEGTCTMYCSNLLDLKSKNLSYWGSKFYLKGFTPFRVELKLGATDS